LALGAEFREAAPSKHHLAQATKNCHGRKGQGPSKEEKHQRQKDEEPAQRPPRRAAAGGGTLPSSPRLEGVDPPAKQDIEVV
jgi:hypothetical protein